ncbi:xanthine dehydrogenase family protein subunit M [Ancylobacter sp. 6x-1]|uniref:Xanthine dehydrogenase family protein subunit M n=1 Tax=Ancylobacter crimeensis TaxID=2579147 RepID=A0ABT0DBG6_9HYPH|nr:xanthine dehydrogenase family protein subunit M [Ancylobacter crimeensis]MCK0197294.1 xanthine dehydrogenase family protein subunit M [Ancylobacter crimeensis]
MFPFDYHRPDSLDAARVLVAAGDDIKFLAGGQTLIPTLKQRLAAPGGLVDLAGIASLRGIAVGPGSVTIGAMTPHADVAEHAGLRAVLPALAGLAGLIGDPAVRNRGTLGGSLANNDPTADYPAACLAFDAVILTSGREIPAGLFFLGLFETALEPDEAIVAVRFPIPRRAAYEKFPNPASRYAMAGVMVAETADGVRVAVTGAGQSGVFRWEEAETALEAGFIVSALDGLQLPAEDMIADIHGSGAYRARLAWVMARRAVARLA